jgi:phage-related protein
MGKENRLFDVDFYEKEDGTEPAQDFIESLQPKMMAKMIRAIDMLAENGYELRMPVSEYLNDGIFELRAHVGSDISRVLYFFYVGQKAVLTHGFIKKTNKTPPEEIARAKAYRADYRSKKEADKEDSK